MYLASLPVTHRRSEDRTAVPCKLLTEYCSLLLDDGQGKAGESVIHGIDAGILGKRGGELRIELGTEATQLEVRARPEILADQAHHPVPVTGRPAADSAIAIKNGNA